MEAVILRFRRLSTFEAGTLRNIARDVNPAEIFDLLWGHYGVEADLDLKNQGEPYQKVMTTLKEACAFVKELIEDDWGDATHSEEESRSFKMAPYCYEQDGSESYSLHSFLSLLLERSHLSRGRADVLSSVLGVVECFDFLGLNIESTWGKSARVKMVQSVQEHFMSAYARISQDWQEITTPPFNYKAYLRSDEWKTRRDERVAAAGNRCQVCNDTQRLNVHHRTYERIGNELPEDLFVLCRSCHQIFHENGRLAKPAAIPD